MWGCGLLNKRGDESSKKDDRFYPHEAHMDEDLICVDCHKTAKTGDRAGMPGRSACEVCHEDFKDDPAEEPDVAAFFPGGEARYHRFAAIGGDLRFSHRLHADAEVACDACHGDVTATEILTPAVRVEKDDCLDCHAKKGVTSECAACHATVRRDAPPATHGSAWTRQHGDITRGARATEWRNRCSQCHTQSTCDSCHLRERPSSHTTLWRRRTHGIAAGFDRDACATCHRSDSCLECHETTRPISHVPSWGQSPAYLHCSMGCHVSASGAGCATCHRSLQGHADAPSLAGNFVPPPHPMPAAGLRCTACHEQ